MTKKYRLIVDTPWSVKGTVYIQTDSGGFAPDGPERWFQFFSNPSDYPHLFEPIEEKTDVERVRDWIVQALRDENFLVTDRDLGNQRLLKIAKKLLSAGLNVDKLEGVG